MKYICDCGWHYQTEMELYTCQAGGHFNAGYNEAIDALESTPPEYRDEAWHIARAEIEILRKNAPA